MIQQKLAIIGGGNMGCTIAERLLAKNLLQKNQLTITVRRQKQATTIKKRLVGAPVTTDNHGAFEAADVIILCVKPQDLLTLLDQMREAKVVIQNKLIISIAAGVSLAALQARLPAKTAVIRAIPNTPSVVGAGMTAFALGPAVSAKHKKVATTIFAALGEELEVQEKHLDTVTGLSASGPAFVYVIIEALADGGVMRGLPRKVAIRLAAQTLLGSAKMVLESGRHPADLKDDVTTPAGCTIGALLHLEDGRIRSVLARGVEEAARIATKLGEDDKQ